MKRQPCSFEENPVSSIDSRRSRRSESGDTLIEVLLAIVILGLASVSILLAFATTISGSAEHRSLTTMDTVLRTAAEDALSLSQQGTTAQFETCPTSDVPTSLPAGSLPTGYTASISQPQYWNSAASNFTGSCVSGSTNSPQLVQITVTSPSGKTGSISFVVNDPQARPVASYGTETQLVFLTPPVNTSYTAGQAFPVDTEPVVAVEDAQGNIVASDGLPPVTLSLNPPAGVSNASLSGCAASIFRGVVTFSGCSLNVAANGYTLTATDSLLSVVGDTSSVTSNPFQVIGATASQFAISSSPISGSATSSATLGPITVQEQDVYGNPTTSPVAQTVNLASNSTGATTFSATPGGASITSITIPAGSSSANFYYGDTAAGTPTITASGGLTSDTQTEVITGGPATQLAFTTSPSSPTAAGASLHPVVTAFDSFGNVATGDSSAVTLALTGGTSGATLSPCSGTESLGVFTFSGCSVNKVGSGYALTATDGSFTGGATSGTFAIVAGQPAQFVFISSPVSGAANNRATLGPITVQEQDSSGNPTTSSETITLSSNSSGTSEFANSGGTTIHTISISAGSSTTAGFYYGDTKAGTPTITATSGVLSGTQSETIVGGAATHIVFSPITPGPGIAGSAIPNVVVQAQDSYNNVAPAGSGTVALSFKSGTTGTFASGSSLSATMAGGVATFSNVVINTAGSYTFTGTPTGITGVTNGATGAANSTAVAVSPGSVSTFTFSAPGAQTAGTAFSDTITAKDAFGNVTTGYSGAQAITFSGPANSPSGAVPVYPASVNFTAGVGTATGITLVDAQTTTALTATQGSATGTSGSFAVSAGAVTGGFISTPSSNPTAGTPFTLNIAATDTYGNTNTSFVGQYPVSFTGPSSSPNTAPTYPTQVTFVAGVAPASIKLVDAQTTTLTATVSGVALTTGSFTVNPATVTAFTVANPGTQTSGAAFNETITAVDAYGNTVTGYTGTPAVTFSGPLKSPNNTSPTYPSSVTFSAGVGVASINLVDVQTTTSITATQAGLTGNSGNFAVSAVAPTSVVLASGSGAVSAGDSATIVMSQQINPSTICSAWTGTGTVTLNNATITVANSASNDLLTVTAPGCSSSNFGTVTTGNNYVSANVTFGGSTVSWNPTTDTLTFTLGSTIGNGSKILTNVSAGFPGYTAASTAVKDMYGNSVSTATFTSGSKSRFGPAQVALTGFIRVFSTLVRFV